MAEIYCGVIWGNDGVARHEVIRAGEVTSVELSSGIPLPEDGQRHCTGYYDFREDMSGIHMLCRQDASVTSGHQCRDCQFREGFIALHRATTIGDVPPQLREYIAQEHVLYLATFGLGVVKIGTAALTRHPARWYEQGALAAMELATVHDGIEVRRLESSLSREHQLVQALRATTKTKLLANPPSLDELVNGLHAVVAQINSGQQNFSPNKVWYGALTAIAKRTEAGGSLSILPSGSTDWELCADPDAVGQCLVWDGPSGGFLMDVKPLIGRPVTFTKSGTGGPSQQIALF